jgi:hypothetical protein
MMTRKAKSGWIGAGLFIAGSGLAIVGAALMAPVCFSWSSRTFRRLAEAGADTFITRLETASTTLGTAAGKVQQRFTRAARAARRAGAGAAHELGDTLMPN